MCRYWLLEEIEAAPVHGAHISKRLFSGVSLIGVRRDEFSAAENSADVARTRRVVFWRADTNLDLEGRKTDISLRFSVAHVTVEVAAADYAKQRYTAAEFFTEQGVNWFSCRASSEVVQRNLDCSLGAVIAVHSTVHRCPRAIDVRSITAVQDGTQITGGRNDALQRIAGHDGSRRSFSPTDMAIVVFDTHQDVIGATYLFSRHNDGLEHREADRDRFNGLDAQYSLRGHSEYCPSGW